MALPEPLPEVFGNYAIKGIAEVLPPDAVAWLPVTPGWQVLGILTLLLLVRWGLRRYRRWRRNRYRRLALRSLAQLAANPPAEALASIAALLKATALNAGPRREVAALSGESWLDWLESAGADTGFSSTSRELLASSQYRGAAGADPRSIATLAEEVARWIRGHRDPAL